MKKVVIVLALFANSFIGISEANAVITCPSGTIVSETNSANCVANPVTTIATDLQTVYTCPNGTLNTTTHKCEIPGGYVQPTTYTSTTYHYQKTCESGTLQADGYCHVAINPPITNSQYSPGTTSYSCSTYPYLSLSVDRCYSINNYSSSISATPTTTYPTCPTGYTRSGDNCIKTITEILATPVNTVDGYYCGSTLQTTSLCQVAGYYQPNTEVDSVISYSGTCPLYYTFQKTDGTCNAYSFVPEAPSLLTVYKCTETSWNSVPRTVFYNYDASISSPFGVSRSCLVSTSSPVNPVEGVYLCTSVNINTNNSFFYVSDTDATSSTTSVITQCDFISTEGSITEETEDITSLNSNDCQNLQWFSDYLACEMAKYV